MFYKLYVTKRNSAFRSLLTIDHASKGHDRDFLYVQALRVPSISHGTCLAYDSTLA